MQSRGLVLAGCAAVLLLSACSGADDRANGAVVRDSAGVTIVEHVAFAERQPAEWRLSAEPTVSIGEVEGDPRYQLHGVMRGVRLSDGRIAIANSGSLELRYYDRDGRHLLSSGRRGGGPGEFEGIGGLWKAGDDWLLVYDWSNRRISVFDEDGTFVRSLTLTPPAEGSFPYPIGRFDDGSWLVRTSITMFSPGSHRSGVHRDTATFWRFDATGQPVDSMARLPGSESFVDNRERGVSVGPAPFGRSASLAVHGNGFWYGSGDSYELLRFEIDADTGMRVSAPAELPEARTSARLSRVIRRAEQPVAVGSAEISAYKERELANAQDAQWRAVTERRLEQMSFPRTMAAYSALRTDESGNLWVADAEGAEAQGTRWSVHDGEGRLIAHIRLPPQTTILDIGEDWLLAHWRDELGVEYVRLHRIERNGSTLAEAR
jgi:hypothetical protein